MRYETCYKCYKKSPKYNPKPVYNHPLIDYTEEELDKYDFGSINIRELRAEIKN
ncbi:hypothetical protein IMX26_10170 [Clostridium sp. 'deep sea']|uniref:hypothetical protein n=1 Tax=Clostridium sp. 'deep sea' TaxID=2779445 RepID=UPI0018965B49|nr:hypothetical protein [Clostridium sp. 'deep sea']QOR33863.1 hypothetical protein IMX26_10170 [Clostridium sp. 'deep sea']